MTERTHEERPAWPPERDPALERLYRAFEAQRAILDRTRPWVTGGLAATIAAVFALQLVWGSGNPLAPLYAMGSLVPDEVRAGAWWRIPSAVFLHAGWSHALFNGMALWILGSFLEKVLGASRMLVLVLASAVGGNLASLAVHGSGQSVGASGGIWGLLGAGAVLGFAGRGVLHPALLPGVRRAAAINLGLNVLVSFLPQVNMAAHFGGGAVGALLIATGALTRGLPRYGPLDDFERDRETPRVLAGCAAAAVALAVTCLVLAWRDGRPWEGARPAPVRFETVDVGAIGIRAEVPVSLAVETEPDEGEVRVVRFGNLRTGPLAVRIAAAERPAPPPGADDRGLDDVRRDLSRPPPGFVAQGPPEEVAGAAGPLLVARWSREDDGTVLEVAALRLARRDVVVYAGYRSGDAGRFAGTAARVGRSVVSIDAARSPPGGRSGLR